MKASTCLGSLASMALGFVNLASAAAFGDADVASFTDKYCSSCHNDVDQEGGLDLTTLKYDPDDAENLLTWVKVHDRVQSGEMPPKDKKRPEARDLTPFVKGLSDSLTAAEQATIASTGRATRRRMNRTEYENALRDILNTPWIQVKEQLPEDGEAFRFNKVANALDVSHVHMARYMSAAEYALRQAMAVKYARPPTTTKRYYARDAIAYSAVDNNPDRGRFPVEGSGPAELDVLLRKAPLTVGDANPEKREREAMAWTASNYVTGFGSGWTGGFRAPVAGRYRVKISGYSIWVGPNGIRTPTVSFIGKTPKGGDPQAIAVLEPEWFRPNYFDVSRGRRDEPITVYAMGGGTNRLLGGFDVSPEPTVADLGEVWFVANEHLTTDATRFFRSRPTGSPDGFTNPLARRDGLPGVAMRWMEIEGPIYDPNSDSGYKLLFADLAMKRVAADQPGVLIEVVDNQPEAPTPAVPQAGRAGGRGRGPNPNFIPAVPPEKPSLQYQATAQARLPQGGRGFGPGGRGNVSPLRPVNVEIESANPTQDAERLLRGFMARAYRRPVKEVDVKLFLDLIKSRLDKGVGFANAMLAGYTAVLSSPEFVFIDDRPGKLDDHSLATRLALFLWNSEPDGALRARAVKGELTRPEVLKAETARMLADPKSARFVNAFLDYWLEVRRMDETTPSTTLYNDYYLDDSLVESALAETRMFFTELLQKNLPAKNIVDSDFTYVNGRLAQHYGLPNIEGYAMRRVPLPADSARGGVMTQASVLKVTANGTTTSPVLRGKWIMERVIGYDMPPPPAAVPAVEPDIRGAVTIRQQLDKHRADEACAMCHRKIDPPGFALESFDVMGAWRDRYRAESKEAVSAVGFGKNGWPFAFHHAQPVDPSGELPGGKAFKDVREFKKLLLEDETQIARNLARQLSVFATGAPVRFSDRAKIDQIVEATKGSQYGVRSIIDALIQSELFRNK